MHSIGLQDLQSISLEGNISGGTHRVRKDDKFSTLDEPVKTTVMRDIKAVAHKFYHVLYPKQSAALLKDWDLWGPLFLCTIMAMLLQNDRVQSSKSSVSGPEFAEVVFIFWVGAIVVTFNIKLLGGDISVFQSLCVLGYCVLPLTLSLLFCRILLLLPASLFIFIIRFVIVCIGFAWASYASTAFLGNHSLPSRKALAIYPICLFYFVISWLIISHTQR